MDAADDRRGFVAVYPNGTGPTSGRLLVWNAGTCCGRAPAQGVDDVGFLLRTLDALAERVAIDRTRVYATGLSNGSMMAPRLAAGPQTSPALVGAEGHTATRLAWGPGLVRVQGLVGRLVAA